MTDHRDKSARTPERGSTREDELATLNKDDLKELDPTDWDKGADAVKGGSIACGRTR
jgi:hypothetical protein